MQRALTNSEHDRKIMAERLEALKAAQTDAKNRHNVQQDRMQQMKNEQADAEVYDLLSVLIILPLLGTLCCVLEKRFTLSGSLFQA